jgi:hypothetical protein
VKRTTKIYGVLNLETGKLMDVFSKTRDKLDTAVNSTSGYGMPSRRVVPVTVTYNDGRRPKWKGAK